MASTTPLLLVRSINNTIIIGKELLSENKSQGNIERFRKLRNEVTKNLRNEKLRWQKQKLETCGNDSGKLWKNMLGWLGWCSSGSPSKLYHEGQIVTSPARLADIMNKFFISKVDKIRENLPMAAEDPLKTLKHMMKDKKK